jgi:hypothetical protein
MQRLTIRKAGCIPRGTLRRRLTVRKETIMSRFTHAALAAALLLGGAAPALAGSDDPYEGPARPPATERTVGGQGQASPGVRGPATPEVSANGAPALQVQQNGDAYDVTPAALAGKGVPTQR